MSSLLELKRKMRPEYYEQIIQKLRQTGHQNSGPAAHRKRSEESAISESILSGKTIPRIDGPVRISIRTSRRNLPRDVGAISIKAAIDSIVSAGVLQNDNRAIIPEIPLITEIIGQEERTEIIIERCSREVKLNDP